MTRIPNSCIQELEGLEGVESDIGVALQNVFDNFVHADCFGVEQRSEIHAILKALRDDTLDHRKVIRDLADNLKQGGRIHA